MRVHGHELARPNAHLKNAHSIIFKQQPVMLGGRD
jgi:hypothetical protein